MAEILANLALAGDGFLELTFDLHLKMPGDLSLPLQDGMLLKFDGRQIVISTRGGDHTFNVFGPSIPQAEVFCELVNASSQPLPTPQLTRSAPARIPSASPQGEPAGGVVDPATMQVAAAAAAAASVAPGDDFAPVPPWLRGPR